MNNLRNKELVILTDSQLQTLLSNLPEDQRKKLHNGESFILELDDIGIKLMGLMRGYDLPNAVPSLIKDSNHSINQTEGYRSISKTTMITMIIYIICNIIINYC